MSADDSRSSSPPDGFLPEDLAEVLDRHLALIDPSSEVPPMPAELEPILRRQLTALGMDDEDPSAQAFAAEPFRRSFEAGIRPDSLYALAQAYGRGVGRIAAAEAEVVRRVVRDAPPDQRARVLDELFSATLPMTVELFRSVQAVRLREQLVDSLDPRHLEEADISVRTVGLVDVVSSTEHLASATPESTIELVDALYDAGQAAARASLVHVVKYVGDGVFLLGRDTQAVADAAAEAIRTLSERTPFGVKAGIAQGPVVRRAGDYFGFVVNVAHRLTSEAQAGTVLVEADAVGEDSLLGDLERVTLQLRGVPHPTDALVLRV